MDSALNRMGLNYLIRKIKKCIPPLKYVTIHNECRMYWIDLAYYPRQYKSMAVT